MRKNIFLIHSKLQRRYLRLIIWSLILPTLIVGGCMYYLTFTLLAQTIAIPEFIASTLFPVIDRANIILLFALPVVFLILFAVAAVISHRMLGPIERLKRELEVIAAGDYSKRIYLRRDDDLKSIADNINKLLDRVK